MNKEQNALLKAGDVFTVVERSFRYEYEPIGEVPRETIQSAPANPVTTAVTPRPTKVLSDASADLMQVDTPIRSARNELVLGSPKTPSKGTGNGSSAMGTPMKIDGSNQTPQKQLSGPQRVETPKLGSPMRVIASPARGTPQKPVLGEELAAIVRDFAPESASKTPVRLSTPAKQLEPLKDTPRSVGKLSLEEDGPIKTPVSAAKQSAPANTPGMSTPPPRTSPTLNINLLFPATPAMAVASRLAETTNADSLRSTPRTPNTPRFSVASAGTPVQVDPEITASPKLARLDFFSEKASDAQAEPNGATASLMDCLGTVAPEEPANYFAPVAVMEISGEAKAEDASTNEKSTTVMDIGSSNLLTEVKERGIFTDAMEGFVEKIATETAKDGEIIVGEEWAIIDQVPETSTNIPSGEFIDESKETPFVNAETAESVKSEEAAWLPKGEKAVDAEFTTMPSTPRKSAIGTGATTPAKADTPIKHSTPAKINTPMKPGAPQRTPTQTKAISTPQNVTIPASSATPMKEITSTPVAAKNENTGGDPKEETPTREISTPQALTPAKHEFTQTPRISTPSKFNIVSPATLGNLPSESAEQAIEEACGNPEELKEFKPPVDQDEIKKSMEEATDKQDLSLVKEEISEGEVVAASPMKVSTPQRQYASPKKVFTPIVPSPKAFSPVKCEGVPQQFPTPFEIEASPVMTSTPPKETASHMEFSVAIPAEGVPSPAKVLIPAAPEGNEEFPTILSKEEYPSTPVKSIPAEIKEEPSSIPTISTGPVKNWDLLEDSTKTTPMKPNAVPAGSSSSTSSGTSTPRRSARIMAAQLSAASTTPSAPGSAVKTPRNAASTTKRNAASTSKKNAPTNTKTPAQTPASRRGKRGVIEVDIEETVPTEEEPPAKRPTRRATTVRKASTPAPASRKTPVTKARAAAKSTSKRATTSSKDAAKEDLDATSPLIRKRGAQSKVEPVLTVNDENVGDAPSVNSQQEDAPVKKTPAKRGRAAPVMSKTEFIGDEKVEENGSKRRSTRV